MRRHAETKIRRHAVCDVLPGVAPIVAAVKSPVVLQKQPLRPVMVLHNLMHALAEFRMFVWQKLRSYSVVPRLPRCSAVVRAVRAGRGDGDHHALWVCRVRHNRMQAQPAAAGLPLWAMRMIEQPFYR